MKVVSCLNLISAVNVHVVYSDSGEVCCWESWRDCDRSAAGIVWYQRNWQRLYSVYSVCHTFTFHSFSHHNSHIVLNKVFFCCENFWCHHLLWLCVDYYTCGSNVLLLQEFWSRAKSSTLFISSCLCNVWLSHSEAQCSCEFLCHVVSKSSGNWCSNSTSTGVLSLSLIHFVLYCKLTVCAT